ncbi:MAG TPA: [FeFe] hydrogenase H-cluster radical SAM maturase HydE, partial [Alphaproteobacteria bacterium]|nr:[FeFe] hydrogenase H-cluster radical SAM maturase HydE [Alphaproteobacteria bacterium]
MKKLDKTEIVRRLQDDAGQEELLKEADEVRRRYVGDEVHLRGLIEFSNICR